ncbi:hypothetical protein [Halosegnis sp.]|uniref:hypothetical protein n=1 Tax=Halosegnis sp. TaxID=2864959 RepID=UPI0035D453D9
MPVVDQATFAAAVLELDPAERTAFVAALWRARGLDIDRVGPGLLRLTDGRTLAVQPAADADATADADVIVALDDGDIDATRLHELALYGVDRKALARLTDQFFDRSLDSLAAESGVPGQVAPEASGSAPDSVPIASTPEVDDARSRRIVAGVITVGVAVFVIATVGTAIPFGSGSSGTAPVTETVTPVSVDSEPATSASGVTASWLPPGVTTGEIDERQLAAVHADLVENHSYHVSLVYREFIDGEPAGLRRERIHVAGDRYVATVHEVGTFRTRPVSFVDRDTYANATHRLERHDDGITVSPRPAGRLFVDDQARLIRYYLSVRTSRVVETTTVAGRPGVWLATNGDPWPGVTNAVGSALVDRRGLVHELVRRYDDPEREGVSVVVALRVRAVGETSVERPDWVGNATTNQTVAGGGDGGGANGGNQPVDAQPHPARVG